MTQSAVPATPHPAPVPTTTVATAPPTRAQPASSTTPTTAVQPRFVAAPVATTVPAPVAPVAVPSPSPGGAYSRLGVVTYYGAAPGTCASPTLVFGTVVTVTNPANGASVRCIVDDREADTARQIDLSTATFAQIAPLSQGVIPDAELSW